MSSSDPPVKGLLDALSELIGKRVEVTDAATPPGETVVVGQLPGAGRLAIRSMQDVPFTEPESSLVREVISLVLSGRTVRESSLALEERVRMLERERAELELRNQTLTDTSSRDSLTGLYTRRYVMQKIEEELNRALRFGSPLSLLMVDLDHFKQVNDSFGHPTGDLVLQMVGHLLRQNSRIYDIPGRYGGEEFCLMLPETRVNDTTVVAERIRKRVESSSVDCDNGVSVRITTSIGIAGFESDRDEAILGAGALIERADRALYAAKARGRNRIESWTGETPGGMLEH